MMWLRHAVFSLLVLSWIAASFCIGCASDLTNTETEVADTATDGARDSNGSSMDSGGTPTGPTLPCAFDPPYYKTIGEGLDYIIADDPNNSACRFAFHFAERFGDDTVADIAAAGEVAVVYDIPGFMTATLDFACNTNSSFRCTADDGEIQLVTFDITADDLMNDTVSGKAVRIEVNARGTKPGNQARFSGIIEGILP